MQTRTFTYASCNSRSQHVRRHETKSETRPLFCLKICALFASSSVPFFLCSFSALADKMISVLETIAAEVTAKVKEAIASGALPAPLHANGNENKKTEEPKHQQQDE